MSALSSFAIVFWTLNLIVTNSAVVFNKFATKNTYNASNTDFSTFNSQANVIQSCEPIQVIAVIRHGIRYPGTDDPVAGKRITSEFRRRGARPAVVDELEAVLNKDLPKNRSNELSETGTREHHEMGFRFASNYQKLYSSAKNDEVLFISSSSPRAIDSCRSFQKGFVEDHKLNLSMDIKIRDNMTRFFDLCSRYLIEVRRSKSAQNETQRFQEMNNKEINSNVAKHLGISELQIKADDLNSLYKIAACEVAIANSHRWLDLLSAADLDILEYIEDLETYWKLGSGYPISYEQSCPLLADIFKHMDDAIVGNQSKKGVFYFGHAETVVPLITLLGLFKDGDSLRAGNFQKQQNRAFKTGKISPFSTNVAFVLHKCSSTTQPQRSVSSDEFKVQMLFKEQSILLPHVCSSNSCPYGELKKYFLNFIDGCNFDDRCLLSPSATQNIRVTSKLTIIVAVFILINFCI